MYLGLGSMDNVCSSRINLYLIRFTFFFYTACEGLDESEVLTSQHIAEKRFENCTQISGNIIIASHTFNG